MRYTEYHNGVAVIKDKDLLKDAMQKLAKIEDEEEISELKIKAQDYCDSCETCNDFCILYQFCSEKTIAVWDLKELMEANKLIDEPEEGKHDKDTGEIWRGAKPKVFVKDLKLGAHFNFKGFEWVVLDDNVDGGIMAIMASAWNNEEYSFDDDGCNNYAKSSLRRKLLNELLPVLGEDNLIPHEINLVADNGDDRYGKVTDKVFILSCDEYRKYRKNVPLFFEWLWTCTPWYIPYSGFCSGVRYVSVGGALDYDGAKINNEVAPACVFKKDVVVEEVSKDGEK